MTRRARTLARRLGPDAPAARRRSDHLGRLRRAPADPPDLLHRARRRPADAGHRRRGVARREAARRAAVRLDRGPRPAQGDDGHRPVRSPPCSPWRRCSSSGRRRSSSSRALAGLSTSIYDPAARGYLVDANPPERQGELFGLYGAAQMGGLMLGPAIGGIAAAAHGPADGRVLGRRAACSCLALLVAARVPDVPRTDRDAALAAEPRPRPRAPATSSRPRRRGRPACSTGC